MKRLLSTVVSALALLALSGCGNKQERAGSNNANATSGKKLRLAFVANTSANFWIGARRGCESAEKDLGNVKVQFRLPSTGSAAEQQQMLDDLLATGLDGIAVSPVDPENQTAALNKIAEQALLITVDSDALKSKRVCYVGTDNFAAGEQAGKLIKEALPNGGKIMVFVGKIDAQNAKERFGGIKKELEGSNVQVIDVRTDDADGVRAQKNAEDTLVRHPDVSCLIGLWSYNGPAILNAVKSGGKVGQVKIVCFDDEEETLRGISEGGIYGTIVQQPYEFGRQAITGMARYLGGDKSALASGKQIIPTLSIKKENVHEYEAKLKAMLGK